MKQMRKYFVIEEDVEAGTFRFLENLADLAAEFPEALSKNWWRADFQDLLNRLLERGLTYQASSLSRSGGALRMRDINRHIFMGDENGFKN